MFALYFKMAGTIFITCCIVIQVDLLYIFLAIQIVSNSTSLSFFTLYQAPS